VGIVSVRKIEGTIKETLSVSLDDIGGIGRLFSRDDSVLIKPNLNDDVCYTNKDLVASIVSLLREYGVASIAIGESTFGNKNTTESAFKTTGYAGLAEKLGVRLINFNASKPVETKVQNPLLLESIKIAEEVFEATKTINIPVMKVHYATGVSLGLKNLKGYLVGAEKRRFHETGLDKSIVDLNNTIPTTLTIIDCIECMETMGPKGGNIKRLDTIIVGENIGETDIVGCRIMGFEPNEINHLAYYLEHNNTETRTLEIVGSRIESVISPFKRAEMGRGLLMKYDVMEGDACSTCINALILSLYILRNKEEKLIVRLGSAKEIDPGSNGIKIGFGNCSKCKNTDIHVKGCPPYPFELNEKLEAFLDKK
jgi:uncharacterized protein (DUF362 family)